MPEPVFGFWRSFPTKPEAEAYVEDVSKRWTWKVFKIEEASNGKFDVLIANKPSFEAQVEKTKDESLGQSIKAQTTEEKVEVEKHG